MAQCFFFIEQDKDNPEEGIVRSLCVECGTKLRIRGSWFYDGQIGPWTLKCHKCESVIYLHEEDNENQETTPAV